MPAACWKPKLSTTSNGIRISARCEADQGVAVEVDVSEWLSQNDWDYLETFYIERATNPQGPFVLVGTASASSLDANHRLEFLDLNAGQEITYYYRVWFTYTYYMTEGSPDSNIAFVRTDCPQPRTGAELVVSCRSDRIVLKWAIPEWPGTSYSNVTLWRSTDKEGLNPPYSKLTLDWDYWGQRQGMHVDRNVSANTAYFYYLSFTSGGWPAPNSAIAEASTCDTPLLGPMDVAFIIDNSNSSVKQAIDIFKITQVIDAVIDDIETASGGDYRLALVSTDHDIVNVRLEFTDDRGEFKSALQNLPPTTEFHNLPESTDECLNTVVNGLSACHRDPQTTCNGNPEHQIGDFDPPFGRYPPVGQQEIGEEREALKVVVLITDDLPGGFCDSFTPEIRDNAERYAKMARCKDIRINAIMVDSDSWEAAAPIMLDYAAITGGWYSNLGVSGEGIEDAILSFVYEGLPEYSTPDPNCEEFLPIPPCGP